MHKTLRSNRHQVLCKLLIEARKKAHLNQTELAKRLGRRQPYISKIEIGERRVDLVELIALAEAMGADPLKIFKAVRKAKP